MKKIRYFRYLCPGETVWAYGEVELEESAKLKEIFEEIQNPPEDWVRSEISKEKKRILKIQERIARLQTLLEDEPPQKCPDCYGDGRGHCKDPQCGDSTWDHYCGEGGTCLTCKGTGCADNNAWVPTEEQWGRYRKVFKSSEEDLYQSIRDHTRPGDKSLRRLFQIWGDKSPEPYNNRDVHTEHCCVDHGCKYCDLNCSVVKRIKVQTGICEVCNFDLDNTWGST